MKKIRILIADDHGVVRKGLRLQLELHKEFEVVGEAGDGREAVAMADELSPDIIIMDINMPRMDGIEATKQIKKAQPGMVIIAVSVNDTPQVRELMQKAGASAFVSKNEAGERLYETIMAIEPLATRRDDTR